MFSFLGIVWDYYRTTLGLFTDDNYCFIETILGLSWECDRTIAGMAETAPRSVFTEKFQHVFKQGAIIFFSKD